MISSSAEAKKMANRIKMQKLRKNQSYRDKEKEKNVRRMQQRRTNSCYRSKENSRQQLNRLKQRAANLLHTTSGNHNYAADAASVQMPKAYQVWRTQWYRQHPGLLLTKYALKGRKRRINSTIREQDNRKKQLKRKAAGKRETVCSCTIKQRLVRRFIRTTTTYRLSDEAYARTLVDASPSQRYVHDKLNEKIRSDRPFTAFLTGVAGTGKSQLVRSISETMCRWMQHGSCVLRTALTGRAAYNIRGRTLHSAFSLPLHDFVDLSPQQLKRSRIKFRHLRFLIIDEISTVGSTILAQVDRRLRQILDTVDVPFGGVSVLGVGDVQQLPPIRDDPVFTHPLWESFETFRLTDIVRQRDDLPFAAFLQRLADGTSDESDQSFLESRRHLTPPPSALHLFRTNAEVRRYNMASIDSKCIVLSPRLFLKLGVRYMLTRNICVNDGLVNGAIATLREIKRCAVCLGIKDLGMQFDAEDVGRTTRNRCGRTWTPVEPIATKSFPVAMAEGMTVYKAQGATLATVVVHESAVWTQKELYVAMSRVTRSEGLFIV